MSDLEDQAGDPAEEPEAPARTREELEEQAQAKAHDHYATQGLLTEDGDKDRIALSQWVFEGVKGRVAVQPKDRDNVYWTRSQMVMDRFGVSRAAATQAEDPELEIRVYDILDGDIWRVTSMDPEQPVQALLNGDGLLCRREVYRKEAGIYVTKNKKCLLEDYSAPQRKKVAAEMRKLSARMELAVSRVPEHSTAFLNEFRHEAQDGLKSGSDRISRMIDAGKDNDTDDLALEEAGE